jgi:hypothetical protein
MLRQSPVSLFRPLPALMKLKIHHPLPLNARESRALLNLLTSSFRSNLDAEHPIPRLGQIEAPDAVQSTRRRSISGEESNHADRHLHSVLTNPLFNTHPRKSAKTKSDEPAKKDPMETFDRAVGMGMMDIRYATACLLASKRRIIESSILNVRDGMRASGAGLKVLKWLKSSGIENDVEFLKDTRFADVFMEFIVAEGLQEAAWKWIKMSFDSLPAASFLSGNDLRMIQRNMAWPLFCLVRAETAGHESLDAAFLCMSRAAGYLRGLSAHEMRPILARAGVYILQKTLSIHKDRPPPTESHFESFLGLIPAFLKNYDLHIAHLHLVHPTRPNADMALEYLRSIPPSKAGAEMSERQISLGRSTILRPMC